jgi:hypothetical protein
MLQSPQSESSSVGMLRSAPGSASREEPLICGEVAEDESSPCLPRPCDQSCCSNPFDGAPRALASGRRSVEMLQSPTSLGDHRSVMTASTPSAMVTSCETMVMSPPKLELGDVPPSEEALEVECATLVRISEDDNDINVTVEPGGGSTVDAAQSVDEEDFNFDFLHDDQEPDMEWSDGSDDEDLERNARSHVGCGCAPKSDADAADAILLGDGSEQAVRQVLQSALYSCAHVQATATYNGIVSALRVSRAASAAIVASIDTVHRIKASRDGPLEQDAECRAPGEVPTQVRVRSATEAMAYASRMGYPVLLKTSENGGGARRVACPEQMEIMYEHLVTHEKLARLQSLSEAHQEHGRSLDQEQARAMVKEAPVFLMRLGEAVQTGDFLVDARSGNHNTSEVRSPLSNYHMQPASFKPPMKPCAEQRLPQPRDTCPLRPAC